jgi:DNA-binding transcriptional regulator GbsR (MarR family)
MHKNSLAIQEMAVDNVMNKHFLLAQDICIEHASQISSLFGLSDGMARIVALLYMSPDPVSIPTICEKLSLTKGTVSLYLRMLAERKIIVRAWSKRQGKQKFHEINPALWSDFMEDLRNKASKKFEITEEAIDKSLQALRKGEKEYKGEDRIVSKLLSERLDRVRELNTLSRAMMDRSLISNAGKKNESILLKKIHVSND